jgi:hypothetical protein
MKRISKRVFPATPGTLVLLVLATLFLSAVILCAPSQAETTNAEFPYKIQPETGATEFAPGDQIIITSLRGNRKHLEPGGRYLLEGTYTLTSAGSADLAWFATARAPAGTVPVAEDEHAQISKGAGGFHLVKTLLDDGWGHVSFYVNGHSHGGIYFGEKGYDKTVLRQKGWSDFTSSTRSEKTVPNSLVSGAIPKTSPDPANLAIMHYLGSPVAAPANLEPKYSPGNLEAAFKGMSQKAGWNIQKLAIDNTEFPFLIYGVLNGRHQLDSKAIRAMEGYDYGGSVLGSTGEGSTYFSLNIIPQDQYPTGQVAAINRRLMVRLQMLADSARQSR